PSCGISSPSSPTCCKRNSGRRSPPLCRLGVLRRARRQRHLEPVEVVAQQNLAAQPRVLLPVGRGVEEVLLLMAWRPQLAEPVLVHIDVAGGARAGAAALCLDVEAPIPDHLHDAPAVEPFELVLCTLLVGDMDL